MFLVEVIQALYFDEKEIIMKIIDIHAHIYPDNIAQKAAASVKVFYDGIGDPSMDGTEGMLLAQGRKAGIDKFAALPVAIRPDRVKKRGAGIEIIKFLPFCSLRSYGSYVF